MEPIEQGLADTRNVGGRCRKVIAHVEANLSRRIHVQELATLLGFSASHFCRAFKCAFGASPREYVLRRRIEVAQTMMLTTSEPLSVDNRVTTI
jgi:AraC family transcriptional regulator